PEPDEGGRPEPDEGGGATMVGTRACDEGTARPAGNASTAGAGPKNGAHKMLLDSLACASRAAPSWRTDSNRSIGSQLQATPMVSSDEAGRARPRAARRRS